MLPALGADCKLVSLHVCAVEIYHVCLHTKIWCYECRETCSMPVDNFEDAQSRLWIVSWTHSCSQCRWRCSQKSLILEASFDLDDSPEAQHTQHLHLILKMHICLMQIVSLLQASCGVERIWRKVVVQYTNSWSFSNSISFCLECSAHAKWRNTV